MYTLKPGIKQDLTNQWRLPDRVFFGYGACHILAPAFLDRYNDAGFEAIWINPSEGYRGKHVFVTDGSIAFDYHGYSKRNSLIDHHRRNYSLEYPGWDAELVLVRKDLCKPEEVASIDMYVRGPDQYLHNALRRAEAFLDKYNSQHALYVASDQRFRVKNRPLRALRSSGLYRNRA